MADADLALSVLDLGSAVVKALVVSPTGEVIGWGAAERESGQGEGPLIAAVERALVAAENESGHVPRRVAIGVPADECVVAGSLREARHAYAAERGGAVDLTSAGHQTFAPLATLARLRVLAETLDLDLAGLVPGPGALGAIATGDGAIVVDAGALTTSVATFGPGRNTEGAVAPRGCLTAPIGGAALEARIGERLGVTRAQARDAVAAHTAGAGRRSSAGPGTGRLVAELAAHHADVWRDALETMLGELAKGAALPPVVLLCGGGALLPELLGALTSTGWHVALPFDTDPRVELALPADVKGIKVRAAPGLGAEAVPALCLAAAALGATAGN